MTSERARAASPLRHLTSSDRPVLYLLGVLSAAKGAALVGMAYALAQGITSVIDGSDAWRAAVVLGACSALVRALSEWCHRTLAARAVLGAKERLRARLADRVSEDGDTPEGAVATIATRGLDELDNYYTVFLPTVISAATVPLIAGVAILFADWVSALIVVLTIPLVPLFMTLIGMHTNDRVASAMDALERLSEHLVELARGLGVLVGLGRAREQQSALRSIAQKQHRTTLTMLRTAFLSALALELIATISVAIVAVFIGVRLVEGQMSLEVGLFALLLAPECFTPFREIGVAFHASEEGVESLSRVRSAIDAPRGRSVVRDDDPEGVGVRVEGLTVTFRDRAEPAVRGLSFVLEPGETVLLDGPSGAGKSTVFAAMGGRVRDQADGHRVEGSVRGLSPTALAWLPQRPRTVADTVRGELELYGAAEAASDATEVLDLLGLSHVAAMHPGRLSPGELRRLGFGRVLMRVRDGARVVLLDEPTAHLDPGGAHAVTVQIRALHDRGLAVLIASHDPRVRSIATRTVSLGDDGASKSHASKAAALAHGGAARAGHVETDGGRALTELWRFLRPVAPRFVGAAVLGTLAALFAVALTAVSAWLIVRAAEHPPIMYLMVAIVGVRFFGIGRAVLRYTERLVTHSAVFESVTELRMRLWRGLSTRGILDRAAVDGGRALDRLVRDADQVRDLSVRVVQPVAVSVLTGVSVLVVVALIFPPAIGPYLIALAVSLVLAPAVALLADRAASRSGQLLRSRVLTRFAALISAADDLRTNAVDDRVRRELADLDRAASRTAQRGALALGLGAAIVVLTNSVLAVAMLPITAPAVSAGALEGGLVAVLCLLPLGIVEVLLDHVSAVQQAPTLRDALRRVSITTSDEPGADERPPLTAPIRTLELDAVSATWPGVPETLFEGVSARLERGDWFTITGPSGSGKTTMLMLLLGELPPRSGRYLVNGCAAHTFSSASRRGRIAWCPQEGHLFNSTLRGNLLIARERADAPDDAELTAVLRRVGLGPLLGRLPRGLDTSIGAAGGYLSGGERQRLAVARTLLARADVVLIDEPTAHLDEAAATSLIADLRTALADRIAVLVTHHVADTRPGDIRIDLGVSATANTQSAVGALA